MRRSRSSGYRGAWQLASPTRGGTARSRGSSSTPTRCSTSSPTSCSYHGDVNAALRRMMQQGLRDRNGERLQGLRELLEQAAPGAPGAARPLRPRRRVRRDRPTSSTTSSTRSATPSRTPTQATPSAAATSAAPRPPATRPTDRNFRLDLLPDDLAGKVRELQALRLRVGRGARSASRQLLDQLAPAADAADGRPDERRDAEA